MKFHYRLIVLGLVGGLLFGCAKSKHQVLFPIGPIKGYKTTLRTTAIRGHKNELVITFANGNVAAVSVTPEGGAFDIWLKGISAGAKKAIRTMKISSGTWNWRWEKPKSHQAVDAWAHRNGQTVWILASGTWSRQEVRALLRGFRWVTNDAQHGK